MTLVAQDFQTLVGSAFAATGDQSSTDGGVFGQLTLVVPLLLLGVMLFFMWRSNRKRQQQQEQQRSSMTVGTEVLTQSGLIGVITDRDEDNNVVTLETTPGTFVRVHAVTLLRAVEPKVAIPDDASALTDDSSPDTPRGRAADVGPSATTTPDAGPGETRGEADATGQHPAGPSSDLQGSGEQSVDGGTRADEQDDKRDGGRDQA